MSGPSTTTAVCNVSQSAATSARDVTAATQTAATPMVSTASGHQLVSTSATDVTAATQTAVTPTVSTASGHQLASTSTTNVTAVTQTSMSPTVSTASGHQLASTSTTNVTAATQTSMSPQIEITPEETNFLRLTSLVLKIGPRAVRRMFDMLNPPDNLNKKIEDNKEKLKKLQSKGIITEDQMKVLFPGNKHASSTNFDSTLMMAFLRNISGSKEPKTGWNKKPPPSDCSPEADLARIKYYRNKVADATSCTINCVEFNHMWEELSEAIIRIGGEGFKSETTAMLTSALDSSYHDLYRELRAMRRNIIPENSQILMDVEIKEMVQDDKTFVITNGTKTVRKNVDQFGVVMVTGPPGSGKTSTVNHIALQLQDDGYKICPVKSTKEIIDYWMPEVPQVFIFNDPFGTHDVDQSELWQWKNHQDILKARIHYSSMKILATVRSHIIQDEQINKNVLSLSDVKEVSLINEKIVLTKDERLKIFNAHADFKKRDDLKDMGVEIQNFTISYFPLLCKIYTSDRESKFSDKEFFQRQFSLISKDLNEFKLKDPLSYFCLLYCMINDNNLDKNLLSDNEETKNIKATRKLLLEKCKLSTALSRDEICLKMDTLLNTYLKLEGNQYQFIHDIIHGAFISHVNSLSSDFKKIVLKTCKSKFLNERVRLSSIEYAQSEDAYVILESELESEWGDRILQDMKDGHWKDLVTNCTLHDGKGDILLSESLKNLNKTDFQTYYPCEVFSSTLRTIQDDSLLFIKKYLDKVTILHLIVCLGLNHCVEDVLKSKLDLNLQQLPLNLLLVACITGKTNIAKTLLANRWSARYCITDTLKIEHLTGITYYRTDYLKDYLTDFSLPFVSSFYGHEDTVQLLIENKADINKCCSNGMSPLYVSSAGGHHKVVELLLSHEADIDKCDNYGKSPLYVSSERGHNKVVELLLNHEADINKCDKDGKTPLYVSSAGGHHKVVELLLSHEADINKCDNYGKSPLYVSSERGLDKVVELLLSHEADINKCDNGGWSPLYVSSYRGHDKVVELLLSHKADINKCDKYGKSPSYVSSAGGHDKVVELLLSHEADINKCDKYGRSLLYVSTARGHDKVVELLLSHDADINKCDKYGKTPLYVSSERGLDKVVELLLSHEADINKCDKYGKTPLYVSSAGGHHKVVELLLSHEADKNKCDKDGKTPLYVSSAGGHHKVVELLLSNEADKNKCDKDGKTPLYASSARGHHKVVDILLSHNEDINKRDKDGKTPLDVSYAGGHDTVVKVLLSHGADKTKCDWGVINVINDDRRWKYKRNVDFPTRKHNKHHSIRDLNLDLYHEAGEGNHDKVEELITNGANVNYQDSKSKSSPLHIACKNVYTLVVKCLLRHNADVNLRDENGHTPLHVTVNNQIDKPVIDNSVSANTREQHAKDIVKLLIDNKAYINAKDKLGRTPLHLCIKYPTITEVLLKAEADCNLLDSKLQNPLHYAVDGHVAVKLCRAKTDVNLQDINGRTPLHEASWYNRHKVVRVLLNAGSKFDIKDKIGNTSHEIAKARGSTEVAKLLSKWKETQELSESQECEKEVYCLIIQNFSRIVEEVDPKLLMIQFSKEEPEMNKLLTLIESIRCRKTQCVRFLLEILVHHREYILAVWDNIGKKYSSLKEEIKSQTKPSSHYVVPRHHACRRCSQPAFLEFLTQFPNLPEELLIELLQNGKLKPDYFLKMNKCLSDEEKLELFKIPIYSQTISYFDFVAAVFSVAQKTNQVITTMVCFLNAQLCDDLKKSYSVSDIPLVREANIKPPQPRFFAAVKLLTNKDSEFEKKLVEAVLQRKEDINSKIRKYGKIKTAWLGSIKLLLEIFSEAGKDIDLSPIRQILKIISADKGLKQILQEDQLYLKFSLDVTEMNKEDKDLCWKKIMILSKIEFFQTELSIELFRKEFSKRNIMNPDEFQKKFKTKSLQRPQRTTLFLDFILRSENHVMEAFIDILKKDEDHQLLTEVFKTNSLDSSKYDRTVGDKLQIQTTSNEPGRACADGCTIDEQRNHKLSPEVFKTHSSGLSEYDRAVGDKQEIPTTSNEPGRACAAGCTMGEQRNHKLSPEVFKTHSSGSSEYDRTVGDKQEIPTTSNEPGRACADGCTMDEQRNHKLSPEVSKTHSSGSSEYDRTVGDLLQIPTTSNESEMACAAGCTMDEQRNVVYTNIQPANIGPCLLDQICSSNNAYVANPAVNTCTTMQVQNISFFLAPSIVKTEVNKVNKIRSKVTVVGEGNTSIANFASSNDEDENSDSNNEDDDKSNK